MVHRLIGGIAAVLLVLASCGESVSPRAEPTGASSPTAEFPLTITDDDDIEVTIDAEPQRIVTSPFAAGIVMGNAEAGEGVSGEACGVVDSPQEAKRRNRTAATPPMRR